MSKKRSARQLQLAFSAVLTLTCVAAIGFCLWSLLALGRVDTAVLGAVILLSMAQLVGHFSRRHNLDRRLASVQDLMRANSAMTRELGSMRTRLGKLEETRPGAVDAAVGKLAQQMRSMEQTIAALSQKVKPAGKPETVARTKPARPDGSAETSTVSAALTGQPEKESIAGRAITLMFEPVVRLEDGRTGFYRAGLALERPNGTRIDLGVFHADARREGWFGQLDMLVLTRSAPLVRAMRQRGRDIAVFCPVTTHSLEDGKFIDDLMTFLKDNGDVATGLIIEITGQSVMRLSPRALQAMAHLARKGSVFALAETGFEMPDMPTLSNLGFGYLDVDAHLLNQGLDDSPHVVVRLAADARNHGLQLIASNVSRDTDVARLHELVSLARGRLYAPPRPVRPELIEEHATARVA